MKSPLESIWEKLRAKLPQWVNLQNLVFIAVITSFVVIVLWSERISRYLQTVRMGDTLYTPTPTILPGTPTPFPAEWIASADQTSGIIFGVVIVLLTIMAGTAGILIRDRK
jgi:hypothetical protein